MANFVNEVTYLDNSFTPIPEGVSLKDKEIYFEKTSRYQVLLGGKKGPEQINKVTVNKGGKKLHFQFLCLKNY